MAHEINYCGYRIEKDGIHKIKQKIGAILNAAQTVNVSLFKAFLGLLHVIIRFY